MAKEFNDCEFWLPLEFLSNDDDTILENYSRDSESIRVFFFVISGTGLVPLVLLPLF